MDTRTKIISTEAAREISRRLKSGGQKLTVVTGTFDVLLAAHALHLGSVRNGSGTGTLMVVLLRSPMPLLPEAARAELVAALRMVDYVVIAGEDGAGNLLERLGADSEISRQAEDFEERRRLIEHVQSRHGS